LARCPADGARLIASADKSLVGTELDERYKILSMLGKGGMGVVYVAEQSMIGRKVALKVLRQEVVQDEAAVKRFLTEAKAIASLRNKHTITLHDFGVTPEGLLYYTMELLDGSPLSSIIRRTGSLDHRRAVDLVFQTLDSLEEAHGKGILHRDLKPDNLFVSTEGGQDHVTVLDFGIAKLVGDDSIESVTRTGMICGTPAYLSPEQAMGTTATPASDLYSLGIVLYEMLAGTPPFDDSTPMRVLMRHLHDKPVPIAVRNPKVEVPAPLDQFIQRALEKDPKDRFLDTSEFRIGLREALEAHRLTPQFTPLSSMATHSGGLRSVTAAFDPDEDRGRGSKAPPTEAASPKAGRIGFEADTDGGDETVVASEAALLEAETDPMAAARGSALITRARTETTGDRRVARRWLIAAGIAAAGLLVAGLLVWKPWVGQSPTAGRPAASTESVGDRDAERPGPAASLPPPEAASEIRPAPSALSPAPRPGAPPLSADAQRTNEAPQPAGPRPGTGPSASDGPVETVTAGGERPSAQPGPSADPDSVPPPSSEPGVAGKQAAQTAPPPPQAAPPAAADLPATAEALAAAREPTPAPPAGETPQTSGTSPSGSVVGARPAGESRGTAAEKEKGKERETGERSPKNDSKRSAGAAATQPETKEGERPAGAGTKEPSAPSSADGGASELGFRKPAIGNTGAGEEKQEAPVEEGGLGFRPVRTKEK
jgi:serine/threonine protein kinase